LADRDAREDVIGRIRLPPRGHLALAVLAVALFAAFAATAASSADPSLGAELRRGGLVLVVRHAATDFSKPDQDPVVLDDCSTQRNLSARGQVQAQAIGHHARRLGLRIGPVLASPYCRTLETARLAFGRARASRALLNTIAEKHDARWRRQIRAARKLFGTKPRPGTVTVLVTHGILVVEAAGLELLEGETVVLRPLGNSRFRPIGRILASDWRLLSVG
jgi:phosphohistidine phosphatase SixA